MFTLRKKSKQSGFTLMELLIVIAILGLLLGLIAPRLGGITSSTADNVCDTNNKGIRGMTAMFIESNGRLPSNLTNMVVENADGTAWTLASTQDSRDTAEQVISAAFTDRIFPGLYALTQDDINELAALGVNRVVKLVGSDGTVARPDYQEALAAGDNVMMSGYTNVGTPGLVALTADATADDNLGYGDSGDGTTMESATEVGNPNWVGRIIMAVNDECELITSGLITASALCPTAVLADGMFSHEEFFIILPRLATTAESAAYIAAVDGLGGYVHDVDPDNRTLAEYVDASDTTAGKLMTFDPAEVQEAWQFDVSCPEGHKWPAADAENWIANP